MDSTAVDRFDTSRFEASRNRLASLAYRMLGSATDAEDAVQDAFLHWQAADRRLTPLERAVFLLREAFSYHHAEIAGILDITGSASQQHLHRARHRITA